MTKRGAILFLAGAALLAQERTPWDVVTESDQLDDFHVAPASNPLNRALHDAAEYVVRFQLPAGAEAWKRRRVEVDAEVRRALGLSTLPPRTPLKARTLRTHDLGDCVMENVVFFSRPEVSVPANLYRLKNGGGRLPAVIHAIGHSLEHGKATAEYQLFARNLARLGFVVMVYDAIGHGERNLPGNIHHHAGFSLLPLGETIAGWMVWDSMRAADYLSSRADVDPQRIGIAGNSGGGLNTLFTSAIDSRFRAAAVAGYVFEFRTWMKYGGRHCTCVYLPGLYRSMEWFEIAGLTAPRAMLMLQGTHDSIFPPPAARLAGRATGALFNLLNLRGLARLDMLPRQPHGLTKPFREAMYGWMQRHLAGKGDGRAIAEGNVESLPPDDARLRCDPEGSILRGAPSVVELARRRAEALRRERNTSPEAAAAFVKALIGERPPESDRLMSRVAESVKMPGGTREKIVFVSEMGEYVPAILWRPDAPAPPVVLVAHSGGKAAVAESGLAERLLAAGYAVLALDLRGRGETLGRRGGGRDSNYHLISHSIMWGRPLAGARAFDLLRALDYIATRGALSSTGTTAVGIGDDALPVLLAATADPRIAHVACAGYDLSFTSQMIPAPGKTPKDILRIWNSGVMNNGRLNDGERDADAGSVVPGILRVMDLADFAAPLAGRRVLFAGARNAGGASEYRRAWERNSSEENRRWFLPERQFSEELLLDWLRRP